MNNLLLFISTTFEKIGLSEVLANKFSIAMAIICLCLFIHGLEQQQTARNKEQI